VSRRGHTHPAPLAASLALALLFSLSACGDDDAGSATDEGPVIEVTREGDEFTPNGARVDAVIGEPVILSITADEAGELHVHSVPEQEIAYDAGTSEHEITIDRPGVVEVESHDPDVIVLQLEVR